MTSGMKLNPLPLLVHEAGLSQQINTEMNFVGWKRFVATDSPTEYRFPF